MNKYVKFSRIFFLTVLVGSIVFGVIYDILFAGGVDGYVNVYNIIMNGLFLVLFLVTETFYKNRFRSFPLTFYYVAVTFAFFAMYLGSFLNYYEKIEWWDTALHFTSGVLLSLLGVMVVNMAFNNYLARHRNRRAVITMIVVGILCSLSVAIFWEFYEFTYDFITGGNMQRSFYIDSIHSLKDLNQYVRPSGRFMDPGLKDTMGDFLMATLGSILGSIIAYITLTKQLKDDVKVNIKMEK